MREIQKVVGLDRRRERKRTGGERAERRDRASGDTATSTVEDRHSLLTTA